MSEIDNRPAYVGFALAYAVGHGLNAVSLKPSWLPWTLLAAGLVAGVVLSVRAGIWSQPDAARKRAETLLGIAWCTGFVALFLAVTGLSTAFEKPELQDVLWPAGSVLVVGLVYLAEGVARNNALHYALGSWLALVASASLFLDLRGVYAVLALAAGGGYAVAAVLERRRLSVAGAR
ncbi:ABC transporter permease [Lentzea sp. NPDC058436]|uniref:ABC transporter permease n=1 Tax=Lentzea sp. NPDC058436 TaxID=3346499 RepID=UPI003649E40C